MERTGAKFIPGKVNDTPLLGHLVDKILSRA